MLNASPMRNNANYGKKKTKENRVTQKSKSRQTRPEQSSGNQINTGVKSVKTKQFRVTQG